MANIKEPISYELSGVPVTGLTPTATVERVATGTLVTPVTITESTVTDGIYYVQFAGVDQEKYVIAVDAGTDSVDNRKQQYSTVAVDNVGGRTVGIVQGQSAALEGKLKKIENNLNKKIEEMYESLLKGFENIPTSKDYTESLKDISSQFKEIKIPELPEIPKVDLKPITDEFKASLGGIEKTIKDSRESTQKETLESFDNLKELVSELAQKADYSELLKSEVQELAAFVSFVEIIKQENGGSEDMVKLIQKAFKKFKNA